MSEYRLTPAAEIDLERIWEYTCENWGINQADFYIDTLVSAFSFLADSPLAAPTCTHIRRGYRKWTVERHSIYFQPANYGALIVRILHDRMNPTLHLQT